MAEEVTVSQPTNRLNLPILEQEGSSAGETANEQKTLKTETSGNPIAALDGGGFVVTWQSDGQDNDAWDIYGQRFDAHGGPLGDEFLVNTRTTSNQQQSSVAALDGGGFVVTWMSSGQEGSGDGIYGQRFDADGVAVGTEFHVNTYTDHNQEYSSVAALDGGGFVVTWMSFGQDNDGWGIYGQRYGKAGVAMGGEFQINETTTGVRCFPGWSVCRAVTSPWFGAATASATIRASSCASLAITCPDQHGR